MLKRAPLPLQQDREAEALKRDSDRRVDFGRGQHDADRAVAKAANGDETITIPAAGTRVVFHGLGRLPRGWRILDKDKVGDIWRTAWDTEQMTLETDAAGDITIRLEVL
jgi:hypothetical protein